MCLLEQRIVNLNFVSYVLNKKLHCHLVVKLIPKWNTLSSVACFWSFDDLEIKISRK